MDIANVYIDYQLNMEEGTSLINVLAQGIIYEDGTEEPIQVGEACLHLFNTQKSSYIEVCGEADCLSKSLSYSLRNLDRLCDINKLSGLIAIFHSLKIDASWSGKGVGQVFYKKIEEQLVLLNVEMILLTTCEDEIGKDNTSELPVYFKNLGFYPFQQSGEPIMYKKLLNPYIKI